MTQELVLDNLTAGYDDHPAVHHLSVRIPAGAAVALLGPNGAGKSTLLKVLAGELAPMTGRVVFPSGWAGRIAYLPQRPTWHSEFPLSVFDATALALWPQVGPFRPLSRDERNRVAVALERVGLGPWQRQPVGALSGGQQQRVRLAQILLSEAALVLLDEPFTALDQESSAVLESVLRDWHGAGVTVIAALHDTGLARRLFSHALLLARELVAFDRCALIDWDRWHLRTPDLREDAPWCPAAA